MSYATLGELKATVFLALQSRSTTVGKYLWAKFANTHTVLQGERNAKAKDSN